MIGIHRRISGAVAMLTLTALVLTGCTSEASSISRARDKNGEEDVVDTGFTLSAVGSFDSADTAVVLSTDPDNKAVSLINMETGKQYTLYYDGTTYVKDKYDGPMSISQIKAGDVVDVTFLKGKKKLASIKRSPNAWVLDNVYNYDLAGVNKTASIGSQIYALPDSAVVLSEGRRVDKAEVASQDVVTISGIDHKIYSVNVDRGHGYLSLKNEQPLLGGWIEVGNSVIRQVTEDMLLVVPEGSYQVALSNKNVGCVKEVTVERDKEVVLDVSDLEVAEDAVGKILFTVEPESAKVSVDGKPVDISKAVELKYGIHQIQAEANGYDTLMKYIQVGSEYASISFKLEESRKNREEDSVSSNSVDRIPWQDTMDSVSGNNLNKGSISDNTLSVSENTLDTSNQYKVYVDSPKDVEVYLDGNYVGISPVRFTKTVGRHEITLKKSGYKTKTYTIYLENTREDETYSFSALEKEGSEGVKKTIPKEVAGAVSELSDCKLTNGTDVLVAGDLATLQPSGKDIIVAAVKNAVKAKIGEAETEKYTFTIEEENDKLMELTPPGDEDGKGMAVITIYRAGYESQTASCNVVIVKKAGEDSPKPDEQKLSLTVRADSEKAGPGETVTFTAMVTNSSVKNPTVVWEPTELASVLPYSGSIKINGNSLILSVEAVESEETFSATATYEETDQSVSKTESIRITPKDEPSGTPPDIGESDDKDPSDPNGSSDPVNPGGEEDNKDPAEGDNGNSAETGNQTGTDNAGTEEGEGTGDTQNGLTTAQFKMEQEAHPIRKWFSSLFKK